MTKRAPTKETVTAKGVEERRDAILKRMLNTPPKPKKGKGGVKRPVKGDSRG